MGDFPDGAYIDTERRICKGDGALDDLGRYVDERGYIRLSSGEYEENWFVDALGEVHNGSGANTSVWLTVPAGWSVMLPDSGDVESWGGQPLAAQGQVDAQYRDTRADLVIGRM